MFYRYNSTKDNWSIGSEIHFPDGTILNDLNKIQKDGWQWYDAPPQAYLDWAEAQEEDIF